MKPYVLEVCMWECLRCNFSGEWEDVISMGICHSFAVVGDHAQFIYINGVEKLYNITTHLTKSVSSSLETAESVNVEARK